MLTNCRQDDQISFLILFFVWQRKWKSLNLKEKFVYFAKRKKDINNLSSSPWLTAVTVSEELARPAAPAEYIVYTAIGGERRMKRFFKPIEKEGSSKKVALSPSLKDGDDGDSEASVPDKKEPLKFVTWNANSLLLRVKNDWSEFTKFVTNLDPDAIAIQVSIVFSALFALPCADTDALFNFHLVLIVL